MTDEQPTASDQPRRTANTPILPRAQFLPWGVASLAVVVAFGVSLWSVNLRGERDDLQDRLTTVLTENAEIRQNANASSYQLQPTAQGPANSHATLWLSLSGSGVLSTANLPQPEEGFAYQLWYMTDPMAAPIPGGTFTVDEQGVGFTLIPADVGPFTTIGISAEPEGGSTTLGVLLLSSDVSGARG